MASAGSVGEPCWDIVQAAVVVDEPACSLVRTASEDKEPICVELSDGTRVRIGATASASLVTATLRALR
jgi:hypothetical protein